MQLTRNLHDIADDAVQIFGGEPVRDFETSYPCTPLMYLILLRTRNHQERYGHPRRRLPEDLQVRCPSRWRRGDSRRPLRQAGHAQDAKGRPLIWVRPVYPLYALFGKA